jgi:hypothetical protein
MADREPIGNAAVRRNLSGTPVKSGLSFSRSLSVARPSALADCCGLFCAIPFRRDAGGKHGRRNGFFDAALDSNRGTVDRWKRPSFRSSPWLVLGADVSLGQALKSYQRPSAPTWDNMAALAQLGHLPPNPGTRP